MKRNWRDLPVFAAQATTTDRLSITGLRAWRVKEPVSGRRYTVVRLESRGGLAGYGEGGPSLAPDIAAAKAAVLGRRANETEFIRHRLAALPAMEAAVNNALLDLTAKTTNTPIYQYLGGPTRYKVRLLAQLEGKDENALAAPLKRATGQGFRAFMIPIPVRDSMMWQMQSYVDAVRRPCAADAHDGGRGIRPRPRCRRNLDAGRCRLRGHRSRTEPSDVVRRTHQCAYQRCSRRRSRRRV